MRLIVDSHTHTIASGHAYSTILENAREAGTKGLEIMVMADHGPAMEGTTGIAHFWNLKAVPRNLFGVKVIKGAESNIINMDGSLDIPEEILGRLEFVIAALHDVTITATTREEHTEAFISALKNPFVDTIAHPGNPQFPCDIDRVVRAAGDYNKLIEINNHSFLSRKGSTDNCREFVRSCKRHSVRITCASDSHFCYDVGKLDIVKEMLDEEGFPEELVVCSKADRFEEYLAERKKRIK
ncbi:MAG: phosphatase [Clostridiales bacterium]|nr:phosphatase [Clostridiales bacterium]